MADVYEIIQGIHQAALLGETDRTWEHQSGIEDPKIGLLRDEGHSIKDSRVVDGFKVATMANLLKITYQSECTLSEVHGPKFEEDVAGRIDDIVSFLKKEYKSIVGEALKLKMVEEPHLDVRHMNKTRTWVEAYCIFEITSMDLPSGDEDQEKFEKSFKKWLGKQEK